MRRVAPNPDTYAFNDVVRRDASATSTSRAGTPSRSAMSSNDVRSGPFCNGLKLLNTGSMTTG